MRKKRHTPEEIISKLRQVDVLVGQGTPVADAVRSIEVTEVTYYRWRQEYGGLKSDQVRRMKELEAENQRLRKAIADLTLDKAPSTWGGAWRGRSGRVGGGHDAHSQVTLRRLSHSGRGHQPCGLAVLEVSALAALGGCDGGGRGHRGEP